MKKIFNLLEIINFLIQNNYFKIYLFHQKTNYNLDNQTLYLNYSDLYETMILLKQMKTPPFKIQMNLKMDKKYTFDFQKKILYLKEEPQVNMMVALNQRLYQQVLGKTALFQNFRHFLLLKNSLRLTIKLVFFLFLRLKK
ncbi:hypothetical protein RS022_05840 [Candidatus Phytoplasma rubi]|uniref:Transmembrane protein n=1 Tax=Candidatus Phytoplasma rubi TaxID=399025 RepID=A0ABY7BW35_9MOLU|nr:hypothetical protein [Candidatus Phytoplasma rubi]WAN63441.1 hypothetical protein RS022_05840 [Candidatus Phytoplasma rubi]